MRASMSTVIKTVILSLVSQTGFRNSTVPVTASTSSFLSNSNAASSSSSLNTTITAPANAGASCNAQSISWSSASTEWSGSNLFWTTYTTTREYDNTTFSTWIYSCTSSCGTTPGAPSYCGNMTYISSTTHISTEYLTSRQAASPFPTAQPNCTIASSDCSVLLDSYSTASESYWSITEPSRTLVPSPQRPRCTSCASTACTFSHGGMDLYFFPVTANVSRDYCANEPVGGTATSTPDPDTTYTEIRTGGSTVVNGVTMYEGNVYLSLSAPYVADNCGSSIAPKYDKPRIITMASSDLFSVRGYPHNVIPYSINYADFNDPTPWSAYVGGWYCWNNRPACSEVFQGSYFPVMSMPGQIRQLDPNWASCEYDKFGIFDPPIALQSIPNFLTSSTQPASADPTPTQPEPVVSETASPGQTSNDESPSATATPAPISSPSDPQEPQPSTSPEEPTSGQNPQPNPQPSPTVQEPQPSATHQDPKPSQNPQSSGSLLDPALSTPSTPEDPQNPAPTNSPSLAPNNPQDPTVSDPQSPNLNTPQNPSLSNSPNDPQIPTAGEIPTPNPAPTFTGPANSSPNRSSSLSITIGPTVVPVDPIRGVVINTGTILTNGGTPVVISSSTFSVGTSGLTIISPETSTEISFGNGPTTVNIGPGSTPVVVDPAGTVVLGGTTISPSGAPVTIGDSTLSMGSSNIIVVGPSGTSTIALPTSDTSATQVFSVGSNTFTMTNGDLVLGPGTSIRVGDPAVTIDGTTFSVASTGLVVSSSGGAVTKPITATSNAPSPSRTGTEEFPGAAGKLGCDRTPLFGLVLGMMGAVLL